MSKRILAITFLIIASFFIACSEEAQSDSQTQQTQVAPQKVAPIVEVDAFKVPQSPVIDQATAKKYVKASAALVELGVVWSDRIDKASDAEKVQILNAYNVARDQLCARIGLAGIAEFNWITAVALPNPQNKAVFEAAGIKR